MMAVRGETEQSTLGWDRTSRPMRPDSAAAAAAVLDEPVSDRRTVMRVSKSAGTLANRLWRKRWLIPVLHTQFWFSACFSLMAPFFPPLADHKGIPQNVYGWIFSTFKLFMFIGSLASERLIDQCGPVSVYVVGLVGVFIFNVCIGSLCWVSDPNIFLGLAFPLAVAGGFLACCYSVSMYSMVTDRFSRKPGTIIALMEFLWGVGNMVGTAAGGILIDLWDFHLPFFTLGAIMVALLPAIIRHGPIRPSKRELESCQASKPPASPAAPGCWRSSDRSASVVSAAPVDTCDYRAMVLRPLFLIDMVTVAFSWIMMSFNEPTMEPYLRQFHFTNTGLGLVYCVQFGCYAVGALLSGAFCYLGQEELFLFIGQLCSALSYLVLGPAPFIRSKPKMGFVYLAQVFIGLGMSAQFVCGFAHALKISIKAGYPDTIKTTGVVASATFIFMVLGAIVTPPIATLLVEVYGYRMGTMFIFVPLLAWSVINLGVFAQSILARIADSSDVRDMHETTSDVRTR